MNGMVALDPVVRARMAVAVGQNQQLTSEQQADLLRLLQTPELTLSMLLGEINVGTCVIVLSEDAMALREILMDLYRMETNLDQTQALTSLTRLFYGPTQATETSGRAIGALVPEPEIERIIFNPVNYTIEIAGDAIEMRTPEAVMKFLTQVLMGQNALLSRAMGYLARRFATKRLYQWPALTPSGTPSLHGLLDAMMLLDNVTASPDHLRRYIALAQQVLYRNRKFYAQNVLVPSGVRGMLALSPDSNLASNAGAPLATDARLRGQQSPVQIFDATIVCGGDPFDRHTLHPFLRSYFALCGNSRDGVDKDCRLHVPHGHGRYEHVTFDDCLDNAFLFADNGSVFTLGADDENAASMRNLFSYNYDDDGASKFASATTFRQLDPTLFTPAFFVAAARGALAKKGVVRRRREPRAGGSGRSASYLLGTAYNEVTGLRLSEAVSSIDVGNMLVKDRSIEDIVGGDNAANLGQCFISDGGTGDTQGLSIRRINERITEEADLVAAKKIYNVMLYAVLGTLGDDIVASPAETNLDERESVAVSSRARRAQANRRVRTARSEVAFNRETNSIENKGVLTNKNLAGIANELTQYGEDVERGYLRLLYLLQYGVRDVVTESMSIPEFVTFNADAEPRVKAEATATNVGYAKEVLRNMQSFLVVNRSSVAIAGESDLVDVVQSLLPSGNTSSSTSGMFDMSWPTFAPTRESIEFAVSQAKAVHSDRTSIIEHAHFLLSSPSGEPGDDRVGGDVVERVAAKNDEVFRAYMVHNNIDVNVRDKIQALRNMEVNRKTLREFFEMTGVSPVDFAVVALNVPMQANIASVYSPDHPLGIASLGSTQITNSFNPVVKGMRQVLDQRVSGVNVDPGVAFHANAETKQLMPDEPLKPLTATSLKANDTSGVLNRLVFVPLPPGSAHGMFGVRRCPPVFDLCGDLSSAFVREISPHSRIDPFRTPNPSADLMCHLFRNNKMDSSMASQGTRMFMFPDPSETLDQTLARMDTETLVTLSTPM